MEEDVPRDSILVTDADSSTGELVLLQLILGRQKIKAIFKDTQVRPHAWVAFSRK